MLEQSTFQIKPVILKSPQQCSLAAAGKRTLWFGGDYYEDAFDIRAPGLGGNRLAEDQRRIAECRTLLHKKSAERVIELASQIKPDSDLYIQALHIQARAYDGLGKPMKAVSLLDEAIGLAPEVNVDFLGLRGRMYQDALWFSEAIRDYDKVLSLRPSDADTLYYRAQTHLMMGNLAKAHEDVSKLQALCPGHLQAKSLLLEIRKCLRQR